MSAFGMLPLIEVETQALTASAASVTFSGIAAAVPAGSRHLVVKVNATGDGGIMRCRVNADSGANYKTELFTSVTTTNTAAESAQTTSMEMLPLPSFGFGGGEIFIPMAFNTVGFKVLLGRGSSLNGTVASTTGTWASAAAVDSLTFYPATGSFAAGATLSLYVVDENYLIADDTLTAPGTMTFASIPATYEHLALVHYTRSGRNTGTINGDYLYMWINDDETVGNYVTHRIGGEVTTIVDEVMNQQRLAWTSTELEPTGYFGGGVGFFADYTDNAAKTYILQHGSYDEDWHSTQTEVGRWASTDPIAKFDIYSGNGTGGELVAGSFVGVYGIPSSAVRHVVTAGGEAAVTLTVPTTPSGDITLLVKARTDAAADGDDVLVYINGDTTAANYSRQRARARESANSAALVADATLLTSPGATALAGVFGGGVITLSGSSKADRHLCRLSCGGVAAEFAAIHGGVWLSSAAVTSVTFAPSTGTEFVEGSVFELRMAQTFAPGQHTFDHDIGYWLPATPTASEQRSALGVGFAGCRLYRTSNQSIANDTVTSILWNAESYDTHDFHSLSTNTDRVTIPAGMGGYYMVTCAAQWSAGTSGERSINIRLNGSNYQRNSVTTANADAMSATTVLPMVAGDYISAVAYQVSGGSLTLNGTDSARMQLVVTRVAI